MLEAGCLDKIFITCPYLVNSVLYARYTDLMYPPFVSDSFDPTIAKLINSEGSKNCGKGVLEE